ncbi:MAG: oligosaccharide flippase family protein [Candidatus Micrarchaeia archaeon]|jgi:O-antigen/teichoic acid export membrane protein
MLRKALKLNVFAVASQGSVLVGGILFTLILTRLLSQTDFGLVSSFISFVVLITLISDMGLRTTATKYVGGAFFAKDKRLWEYIMQLTVLRFAIVTVMGLAVTLGAPWIAGFVLKPEYAYVIQFTGITAIIYSAMHFFEGLVSAANRYEYTFLGSVIVNGARLVLPVAAVLLIAPTAEWTIAGVACGYLMGALAYIVFFRRIYGMKLERPQKAVEKDLRTYALYSALIAIATAIFSNVDTLLLNMFHLAPDKVALYKAAQMVFIGIISLAPISYMLIFTFFVELEAKGQRREQAQAYSQAAKYGLAFFIPVSVMAFVLAGEIISFLYSPPYAPSADALRVFAFIPAFYFLLSMNNNALLARSEIKNVAVLALLSGGLSLALNVVFIPYFGFVGSSLAYAGAAIIPAFISFWMIGGRLSLGIGWKEIGRPVVVSAVAVLAALGVKQFVTTNEVVLLALFPIACGCAYLLMLDKDDRRVVEALKGFAGIGNAAGN